MPSLRYIADISKQHITDFLGVSALSNFHQHGQNRPCSHSQNKICDNSVNSRNKRLDNSKTDILRYRDKEQLIYMKTLRDVDK